METRNVFLDTEIFVDKNYDYNNPAFQAFIKLAKDGFINYYTTTITREEIKANIKKDIEDTRQIFNLFRKNGKVLRNSNMSWLKKMFEKPDYSAFEKDLFKQLRSFESDSRVKEIGIDQVNINSVFVKYFHNKAPFNASDKKNEFPDAFVLASLELWAEAQNEQLYVISGDGDFESALINSKKLIYLKSIEEFLALYRTPPEERVKDILLDNQQMLSSAITEEFSYLGFYIDDIDGDVNEVQVEDVLIEDVLIINSNENIYDVELQTVIYYKADITIIDEEQSYYDPEEGRYLFRNYLYGWVKRKVEIPAVLTVSIDAMEKTLLSIDRVELNEKQDIWFSANRYEEYNLFAKYDEDDR